MHTTRRECLRGALALAAQEAIPKAQPPAPADSSFDPWIEIHPRNLRHNVREVV